MTLKRMDNVLIVVEDLEAAKAFFFELGMELEGEMPLEGRFVDQVVGLENVRCEIAMLRTPDGHGKVELSKFHRPRAVRVSDSGRATTGRRPVAQCQEQTTLPQVPASIRSKPFWKSSMRIWWVSTFCSGKPVSTIWVILYQVSYMRRP